MSPLNAKSFRKVDAYNQSLTLNAQRPRAKMLSDLQWTLTLNATKMSLNADQLAKCGTQAWNLSLNVTSDNKNAFCDF